MRWNLAHRPRGVEEFTEVEVDADTSADAIEVVRAAIPEDHVILYVREA